MTPKIWARIEAIRAISHQFVQRQTAIRWLKWLHRKLSNPLSTCAIWSIRQEIARKIIVSLISGGMVKSAP
jgi:hypothetical protein